MRAAEAARTRYQRWASERQKEWIFTVHELAGFNPAEARRITARCTWEDVGDAYLSKMAIQPGVGYSTRT